MLTFFILQYSSDGKMPRVCIFQNTADSILLAVLSSEEKKEQ